MTDSVKKAVAIGGCLAYSSLPVTSKVKFVVSSHLAPANIHSSDPSKLSQW